MRDENQFLRKWNSDADYWHEMDSWRLNLVYVHNWPLVKFLLQETCQPIWGCAAKEDDGPDAGQGRRVRHRCRDQGTHPGKIDWFCSMMLIPM